jgi:hypothetical protein
VVVCVDAASVDESMRLLLIAELQQWITVATNLREYKGTSLAIVVIAPTTDSDTAASASTTVILTAAVVGC